LKLVVTTAMNYCNKSQDCESNRLLTNLLVLSRILRADVNSEDPKMSWQFFVSHYQNETQAHRDRYFTYRLANGSLWHGIDPPEGATP
jgi:hypothetical protein